ncbi:amidohydrolase [Evansella sp. LMS18]|uniref:amidohydrolase n=1 Tax=Evansella sp. LMS18 TaxID=2924033 RepID=UPI0020D13760|nr:amidohydrolase [Evansella sp. LMS18]UTR11760.1 amidohydrolase [Evansella sp. LMS18]
MSTRRIFTNGKIFTSNPEQPYAEAMIVQDGKIEWIGDESALSSGGEVVVNLQGKRVIPGLIDAHMHPYFTAKAAKQIPCLPPVVNSIKELQEEIRKKIEAEGKEIWVESWGYDEGKLAEKRAPTRQDLDEASTEVPIVATRTCVHIISANSKALELAGITRNTPDPPGGEIDRDKNGEPTGILRETARDLVLNKIPEKSLDDEADLLARLSSHLFSHGITSVTELYARTKPSDYLTMYNKAKEKGYKQRSVIYYFWNDIAADPVFAKQQLDREKQNHIGGIKLLSDGSISGQTAWMKEPFRGSDNVCGIRTCTKEELLAGAEAAKENGVQLIIHAMGDAAIEFIAETFSGIEPWLPDGPSIRIEHACLPSEKALKLCAEAEIAFVPQPIFIYAEIESYIKNLGLERTQQTYPLKTMLNYGIQVALSSDAPATAWADPVNPFVGIKAAVTRRAYNGTDLGEKERISVETAIELYTRGAQEVTRIPHTGQLKPGYFADFAVLDKDILKDDPETIDQTRVQETYMNGELVFSVSVTTGNL